MILPPVEIRDLLKAIGAQADESIDLAEAALILAAERAGPVALEPYRAHLDDLARRIAQAAGTQVADAQVAEESEGAQSVESRIAALNQVLINDLRYSGDEKDYDNLENANLVRVIDRRRGLPVTLGILYLHGARAQGWPAEGLSFPSHFLIRVEGADGRRAILDPFNGGRTLDAAGLRELLKSMVGSTAELAPSQYEPTSNREILVRLQNNIKLRLLRHGELDDALALVKSMLLFAPDEIMLWRETGMMQLRLGDLPSAVLSLEQFVARAPNSTTRHRTTVLLQDLRSRLT